MLSNKKTLITIIALVLILAGAGFLVYTKYNQKKQQQAREEQTKEIAVKQASCAEETAKMTDEQLIIKTNAFAPNQLEETREVQTNIADYLMCRLERESEEFDRRVHKELYARMANHINNLMSIPPAQKKTYLEADAAKMFYEVDNDGKIIRSLSREYSVLSEIALSPMEKLCPDGKAEPGFLEACLGPDKSSLRQRFCNNICDNLSRYLNDSSEFEKSLANTAWQKEFESLKSQASGRMAVAYRLGDRDYADKIWDPIPSIEVKEYLKNYAKSLEYINCREFGFDETRSCERKIYPECEGLLKKAENSICALEAKNPPLQ